MTLASEVFRYHRGENEWELVRASVASANTGVTRLTEDPTVHPGPRAFHCAAVDPSNKVAYLFGGVVDRSTMRLSGQLYRFNSATAQFTFLGGPNNHETADGSAAPGSSFSGTSASSFGGARSNLACWFRRGFFVIAGGYTPAGAGVVKLKQDVWSYEVGADLWRMHSGSSTIEDALYAVTHHEPLPFSNPAATGPFSQDSDAPLWMHGGASIDTLA